MFHSGQTVTYFHPALGAVVAKVVCACRGRVYIAGPVCGWVPCRCVEVN